MKRLVLAAVALTGLTAFAGAASAAPTEAPGVEAKAVHTLRWKGVEIASHRVGGHYFAGADRLRSMRTGEIVGYDSFTGRYLPRTNSARIDLAASVKGGILVGRVIGEFSSNPIVFRGPVLKGTGRFQGADGQMVIRLVGTEGRARYTIRYTT
jgi:hypothetical protein